MNSMRMVTWRLNHCANSSCKKVFERKTHNQKYCSPECCREATNRRIMERYYEKKDNRRGSVRVCAKSGCDTTLSRYNDSDVCSIHTHSTMSRVDFVNEMYNATR
jgi:hypothetical protein